MISNVICNSAKQGLIPQREYFDKDIANSDNTNGYYIIESNDFVYNPRKSADAPYGPISSYQYPEAGIVSPLYLCFRAKREINPLYFEWYFRSSTWHRYIYMSGDSGARHDRVSIKDDVFFAMPINVPSAKEQERISLFLDAIERRIETQRTLVETLKKYKRGLLNKLFSNINSNIYPTVYLSEVADFLQGLTYSPSDVSVSGYLVLRSSNIQNGMLSFDDCVYVDKKVDESLQVKCDDVIMCVRNGSKNLVGKTALIPPNMPMTTWGAFMMIIRSKLNDTYIFHYLNSQMFFSQVFKDTGTATINQITKGILNECRLPLPPETERKQISKMLSSFDAKIQNAEKCLATLVNLKKALLQQLFI
ncbi:restriction endonuclease subunit S [Anaerotignum lactatifermentans]|jgi:type I restriction enzyme S subunit|uniref:restriction endonuclease subunit S n=1 Tax=Anaerotignum lactatifermentans TaxID=160404 RepID=UPI003AB67954